MNGDLVRSAFGILKVRMHFRQWKRPRSAGAGADEAGVGHQPQHREGARPDDSPVGVGAGGSGYRIARAGPHPQSPWPGRWCVLGAFG